MDVNLGHTDMESNTIAQFSELADTVPEHPPAPAPGSSESSTSPVLSKGVMGKSSVEVDEE